MAMTRHGKSKLVRDARAFWYNNKRGPFRVRGGEIARRQIQVHGGPRIELDGCELCQGMEWLSRATKENKYEAHDCRVSERARWLCERQNQDRWSYLHQDFTFSLGCNPKLNAPKCTYFVDEQVFQWHVDQGGNHISLNRRRGFAQAFQHNCVTISHLPNMEWQYYDLIFTVNRKRPQFFKRPKGIPMMMWGHDMWHHNAQEILDHYKPEILLTSYPQSWKINFKIPRGTEVVPYFVGASTFYTRPNLDPERKPVGLLVIGERKGGVYAPRVELDNQLKGLDASRYEIEFSHRPPRRPTRNYEPLSTQRNRYLNIYSEYLGRARFVIFGPCGFKGAKSGRGKRRAQEMMLPKYYECLGSGAIPIMPRVPQMDLLQLEPWVHYVPLSEVWGNNARLAEILESYGDHFHIAQAAVKWHQENADSLLFDHFEDAVRRLTGNKYPRRKY
jgi:hypothetical protein